MFQNLYPIPTDSIVTPKTSGAAVDIGVDGAASGGDFYDIVDEKGNIVPFTELTRDDISIGVERELDTKAIKFNANRKHILIQAEAPQNGYKTYALRFRKPNLALHPQITDNRKLIARDGGTLETNT